MSLFKGKRPKLGQSFIKNSIYWEVVAIAAHVGVVIGKKEGVIQPQCHEDLIIIKEDLS